MVARHAALAVTRALADRPITLLHGARQVGKTTLARAFASPNRAARFVTLDKLTVLAAVRADAAGFVTALDSDAVIDEVQRAPDLFLAIKEAVDRDRAPGRFLLTGSANILLLPRLAGALVGRMEIVTLWPFSQGEIESTVEGFVDAAFGEDPPVLQMPAGRRSLVERILLGGYPEVVGMARPDRRAAWFESYLDSLLARDVQDLARIEGLLELPRLSRLLAARPMALLNHAELSRATGLPQTTVKRYLALLECVFLVRRLPAWHTNIGKRLVRSPKILITDSGVGAHLMGIDEARVATDRTQFGGLLEAFVTMEIVKQIAWSATAPGLFHFRTHAGEEVDLVLEARSGQVVGIEVKSGATVSSAEVSGLRSLRAAAGNRFRRGIVLYTGDDVVPFGDRLWAVPVDALWRWGGRAVRRPVPEEPPGPAAKT